MKILGTDISVHPVDKTDRHRPGLRIELRRATSSLSVEATLGSNCMAVGMLVPLKAEAVTVGVATPVATLDVGVALEPVTWLPWRVWATPQNIQSARMFLLGATIHDVYWMLGAKPFSFDDRRPNTRQHGFMSWPRFLLGVLHEGKRDTAEHRITVSLPEGNYAARASVSTWQEWRHSLPRLKRNRRSITIYVDVGIDMPHDAKLPLRDNRLTHFTARRARTLREAIRELEDHVMMTRALRASITWRPPLRLRQVRASDGDKSRPGIFAPAPPAPSAEAAKAVEWESRDPTTGKWSSYRICPRSELPPAAIVEPPMALSGLAINMLAIGGIGFCLGLPGIMASLLSGAAARDRR